MAENEIVETEVPAEPEVHVETEVVEADVQPSPEKPSKASKVGAAIKEGFRKFVVNLKRRPMNIAFFVLIVSTLVNLLLLGSYAQVAIDLDYGSEGQGLCVFVNQLFCILSLMLFLNSFPKREKKPKVPMLVVLGVFIAVMLAVDIYLIIVWDANFAADASYYVRTEAFKEAFDASWTGVIVHAAILGLAAILTATYPLYGKLINKINTKKAVETNEIKEEIDTSAEV